MNEKIQEKVIIMVVGTIMYILVFVIFSLIAFSVMQIKMAGMNVKDFWTFIQAFDKVPSLLWDEEYQKYREVLDKYKDIKVLRWASN